MSAPRWLGVRRFLSLSVHHTRWIGSFPLFMAVNVSDAIESVHLYEQTVRQMPADDDAEW
jgi:hypothetical protein